MKKFPLIIDVETKFTFREFSEPRQLGISVVVVYDYASQQAYSFFEQEINKMFPYMENASYVIGYNINSFDMQVIQGYYPGNVSQFLTFDILDDIKEKIGRRLALNDVIFATLGEKKTGHGLMAIDYYKEKKFEELKKYCTDDVLLTKKLFDYGVEKGEINYLDEVGKQTIRVNWKKYIEDGGKNEITLTLPF